MQSLPRKSLIKKLDICVSAFVRKKTSYCVTCGRREGLQCGHVFSRKNMATRFDVWEGGNCYAQCYKCNFIHESNPKIYYDWFTNRYGLPCFLELRRRYNKIVKIKDFQIVELLKLLENGNVDNYQNLILTL